VLGLRLRDPPRCDQRPHQPFMMHYRPPQNDSPLAPSLARSSLATCGARAHLTALRDAGRISARRWGRWQIHFSPFPQFNEKGTYLGFRHSSGSVALPLPERLGEHGLGQRFPSAMPGARYVGQSPPPMAESHSDGGR
jgi:hypothetical protein